MKKIPQSRFNEIYSNFKGKRIAVIGDVMLDRYFWGNVTRVSPEAPVPVIDLNEESYHLGGAANVASNLKSLGLDVLLCGVVGNDNSGEMFKDISKQIGIDPSGLYSEDKRQTTVKTRIIGNNQQIVRLDRESRSNIDSVGEKFIIDTILAQDYLSAIIFEDYNKGALSKALIREVNNFAVKKNIPTYVDPKMKNFFSFTNVTVFKPNKKEAEEAVGLIIENDRDMNRLGKELLTKLKCENVLLTLGKDGMMLFEANGDISSVPTHARHVADVSGAGDTAIATLAAFHSCGATIKEAASLANHAAGVVCGKPGIVSITIEELTGSLMKNGK